MSQSKEKDKVKEAEVKRQREFVKDKLYPLLLKNTKSIDDAKNYVYATNTAIKQAFHKMVSEEQVRLSKSQVLVLNMNDIIDKDPAFDRDRELIALFETESIGTADALLDGMKNALDSFIREETCKRELSTLKTDFLE